MKKKNRLINILFTLSFIFIICACDFNNKKESEIRIAKVDKYLLYKSDLEELVPAGTSEKDSLELVTNYINNWIRQKLVLLNAENNLSEEQKNFEKELEDYRNSLIVYKYESELIKQKLNTKVSEKEIQDYYNANKNNFELRHNIVKVQYVKLDINSAQINNVKSFFAQNNNDKPKLEQFCKNYAVNYYLDENAWLFFTDLLKEIPVKTYDQEAYLKNNRQIEIRDTLYYYYVNIKGFKVKESISPLSFERNNIKSIIINKRKLEHINEMEKKFYDEAIRNKTFKIY